MLNKLFYYTTFTVFTICYNDKGIFSFVLQEVVTTDNDNLELNIADYYKHFPKENTNPDFDAPLDESHTTPTGKKVWL